MTPHMNPNTNLPAPFQIGAPSSRVPSFDIWLETETAAQALEDIGLSKRESEVLGWVARGKTNIEIGKILYISSRTVSKHLENIYEKLGVECRTAAVLLLLDVYSRSDQDHGVREESMEPKPAWKRILLVDDDPAGRGVLRGSLESHGYECEEVEHGAAALKWLETREADLVITDNEIPILGGLQFLESLVTKFQGDGPPVVLQSKGNLTKNLREKVRRYGVYAILPKPCTLRELLSIVAEAIEHRHPSKIDGFFSQQHPKVI